MVECRKLSICALLDQKLAFECPCHLCSHTRPLSAASPCLTHLAFANICAAGVDEELCAVGLENDEYVRQIDGYLPTCEVAFIDEIFKANSAILNALLTLLNERLFDNGNQRLRVPLLCLVSNFAQYISQTHDAVATAGSAIAHSMIMNLGCMDDFRC